MPPRGTLPPPLKTLGSRILNARNNKVVSIRGINWFGFNVGMGMVDGLWAGGSAAATDFSLIAYQLRLLGYNAGVQCGVLSILQGPAWCLLSVCWPLPLLVASSVA
jgi:hypothetical protein